MLLYQNLLTVICHHIKSFFLFVRNLGQLLDTDFRSIQSNIAVELRYLKNSSYTFSNICMYTYIEVFKWKLLQFHLYSLFSFYVSQSLKILKDELMEWTKNANKCNLHQENGPPKKWLFWIYKQISNENEKPNRFIWFHFGWTETVVNPDLILLWLSLVWLNMSAFFLRAA